MKIGGLQKTSLMDYPDHLAAIVWTVGCNFRCPFCYNPQLVNEKAELIPEKDIFDFLEKRKNMLEAVTITGGEPLLHKDLKGFIKKIKNMGYLVKVDTNGTFPKLLKELINEELIDYVATDVKAPKKKYDLLTGVKVDISKIEKSIRIIQNDAPDYEFKTTMVPNLLKKEDIVDIGKWIKGSKKYYLQQFKNDTSLIDSHLENTKSYEIDYLEETLKEIKPFFSHCEIRGV